MTQITPLNNQARGNSAQSRASEPASDAESFRDALAQQSFGQLAATLDPSATASVPGAGVALAEATAAPPVDAAGAAAAELVRQDRQQGIRDRGLDAASASTQELRSRSASTSDAAQRPSPSVQAAERGAAQASEDGAAVQRAAGQPASQPRAEASSASAAASDAPSAPKAAGTSAPVSTGAGQQPQPIAASSIANQTTSAATRSNAAIQAVNGLSAAAAPAKPSSGAAPPFSVERAEARTDRATHAKPARTPAQQPDASAQIQRGLAQVLRQRGGTLTMRLTPNELGEVKIALQVQQSRVTGTIEAQTVAARDLLTNNIDALKASLEHRGVTVDRLDVRLQGAAESDAFARHGAEPRSEHAGAQADAGGDRQPGFAGREDRHAGTRDGTPGSPEPSDDRGAATRDRDDGHGRPVEHAGGWLRLDTTA